jgi:hypothetical protein
MVEMCIRLCYTAVTQTQSNSRLIGNVRPSVGNNWLVVRWDLLQ